MIGIKNNIAPEHLSKTLETGKTVFGEIYEGIFEKRKQYEKKDPRNYACKIILNSE